MDHCSLYEVPDTKWERDLSGGMSASQLDQDEDALPTKCARLENDDTEQQEQSLTSTLDWLNDAFDGEHSSCGDLLVTANGDPYECLTC
jgi:hypothetical protein